MAEQMREVAETIDLTGAAELYPGARKVTVDMPNRTAYVFVGRSNRATTVSGAEFDELVKVLPQAGAPPADESQGDEPPADESHEVEPVEAVISVVKEPEPAVTEAAPKPKRGK